MGNYWFGCRGAGEQGSGSRKSVIRNQAKIPQPSHWLSVSLRTNRFKWLKPFPKTVYSIAHGLNSGLLMSNLARTVLTVDFYTLLRILKAQGKKPSVFGYDAHQHINTLTLQHFPTSTHQHFHTSIKSEFQPSSFPHFVYFSSVFPIQKSTDRLTAYVSDI